MRFLRAGEPLDEQQIAAAEAAVGLVLPGALKSHYLKWNGGSPEPYVYEDQNIDTVVSECLPLTSSQGQGTALDAYRTLVLQRRLVPISYFPFAVDGGGDYFFVDCSSSDGATYFYRSDAEDSRRGLVPLDVSISDFWERLTSE